MSFAMALEPSGLRKGAIREYEGGGTRTGTVAPSLRYLMISENLWEVISPEKRRSYQCLARDIDTDVAIVGGGITGLSTALHLAERGISAAVLEAGDIPSGGSGRSVGLVNAGLWIAPDDILEALGPDNGERANAVLGGAPAQVFDLIDRHGIDAQSTRTGTLHLAHNAKGAEELARRAEQFQRRGAPVELLDAQVCVQRIGTRQIECALLDRRAGTINPTAYTRGLARAAHDAGSSIYTSSAVTRIDPAADGWRLQTAHGSVNASRVVLATNAYSDDDWNEVGRHFFRGHFFQVASRPLVSEGADSILPERQGAWDTRTVLSSMRRDAEGRLVLGSLGQGENKPAGFLKSWANRIQRHYFPQLGQVEWEYTWSGQIGFTPDHTLRVFEAAPGILAASGYNGRGITTGTVVGKGFAEYIATGDDAGLPLPLQTDPPTRNRTLWSAAYESGFTLYHAAQCMRILI